VPRFFGGFSFDGDHREDEAWAGFPVAHFVLPSIEMIGGKAGGVLTVRAVLQEGTNPEETERKVEEELRAVRKALDGAQEVAGEEGLPSAFGLEESSEEDWAAMVERGLSTLSPGGLRKVVLARVLRASFSRSPDPVQVGVNLWRQNPGAYVFLFEPCPGRVLLGAAPETVATVSGGSFRATAVAGSAGVGRDPVEQQSLAASLLGSEKDRREHRICVEDMVERLSSIATEIQADPEPHVLALSSIQHLEAGIRARLNQGGTVLSALEALHPTPAVCGFPRDSALKFLRDQESFQRGWYSGPVGWFDTRGNGEFVPALRSAVGSGREWWLFAGAGIVAGSNAVREWAETRIKFHPALKALAGEGVSEDGLRDPTRTWLWPSR